ncbi:MAG: hypothetical protein QG620_513 [Patescibacteria group bacterium]|nr:hypothetical protein [Patescibacteria group bacterium]
MKIGIDASRAFVSQRTGIEEYSYQVIKNLANELNDHQVVLYVRKNQKVDFTLPDNWKIKVIRWLFLWTQAGLSLELLFHPVDALFVPSHVVPLIHPRNTVVVVHGLEFEIMPEAYSFWGRLYMRASIRNSCRAAKKIIAVSKNTKRDLINLYKIPEDKIEVIYEGVSEKSQIQNIKFQINSKLKIKNSKFLLFVGRLEKRKNVEGIIEAYKILRDKHNIPHSLVLAGKPGYGYEAVKYKVESSKYKANIVLPGFISEEEKWQLLANADVFLFPTFYEGFGLPVLEAQALGVPVVTSNVSSLPEVGGEAAAYCDPSEPISIADAVYSLIGDKDWRDGIIEKGNENVKRFSWKRCANSIAKLLNG